MISPIPSWTARRTGLGTRLSPDTLEAWQLERFRQVLRYARGKSRFYHDHLAHVDPGAVTRREDLAGIPFTVPRDIVEQGTRMVCISAGEISRITTLLTSGSQGPPKRICFTRNDLDRTIDFFACGMSTLVTPKDRVMICMSSGTPDSIGDLLQQGLALIGVSSLIYGNIRDPDQAAGRAGEFDCLVGLPAEMLYLARTAPGLRPATVLLSADYVPDSIIQVLESTWQCRVFTHYGMTETGYGGGVQCGARQAYHLRDADLMVEIVDPDTGTPLPPERTGEVVLTTLQNEAMPLIRYRTGDLAKMAAGPCPCGSSLHRLDKVSGRLSNSVRLDGQHCLNLAQLDEALYAVPGLRGYRAAVHPPRQVHLILDMGGKEALPELPEELKQTLSIPVEITIRYTSLPPCTPNGKRLLTLG
ncbi:DVU_1553 family AMP-dependent CoA ligase [Desulfotignum phosphitoxidans]|uniref:F390 synthase-like protein n=2 Tax=Desulfotignum phosphitoxidans TaxID=190898 RepID=S0G2M1_9BACT|nr:AMP-binding protein [Desulfotignum phosphitoxidans]ADB92508.1 F390 synthase-like protein [Desulfotignum phosphitoxidans DSM 13687]EMS77991.1 F390 synthase-like protein [Desulfotignum phosphitoxidans DSM 13687]